jgi:hypothetical protein
MNKVNLIVACDNKFGITDQLNGYIPWILKNDLKFFKQTTLNKTILMGRLYIQEFLVILFFLRKTNLKKLNNII